MLQVKSTVLKLARTKRVDGQAGPYSSEFRTYAPLGIGPYRDFFYIKKILSMKKIKTFTNFLIDGLLVRV